jgi:hypothetical protein
MTQNIPEAPTTQSAHKLRRNVETGGLSSSNLPKSNDASKVNEKRRRRIRRMIRRASQSSGTWDYRIVQDSGIVTSGLSKG